MAHIAVVGPRTLVDSLRGMRTPGPWSLKLCPYDNLADIDRAVAEAEGDAVGWVFTGVVAFERVKDSLGAPALAVDYSRNTLLLTLIELLRDGHSIERLAIDTLPRGAVAEVLVEAGICPSECRFLPYRRGQKLEELIAFHRRCARDGYLSITSVEAVFRAIRPEATAAWMVPSCTSIKSTLDRLVLMVDSARKEDHEPVVVLGETNRVACLARLAQEMSEVLSGTVTGTSEGHFSITTTKGPLSRGQDHLLRWLEEQRQQGPDRQVLRVGVGVGSTMAEAAALARRSLQRCRGETGVVAFATMRGDVELPLSTAVSLVGRADATEVAVRSGLAPESVRRIAEAAARSNQGALTAGQLAERLGVTTRTARKLLNRLALVGYATKCGILRGAGAGRPQDLYQVSEIVE